jgi:thiol-disulfide isomerase/thioredoxin
MIAVAARLGVIGSLAAALLALAPLPAAAQSLDQLAFTDTFGNDLRLQQFRGRPVLVELWASWCTPCIPRLAELDRLARRVDRDRLAIVPISVDRGGAAAAHRGYARAGVRSLPLYLADPGDAAVATGSRALPTILLLDADGVVVLRLEGAETGDIRLRRALARLLDTSKTKAVQ